MVAVKKEALSKKTKKQNVSLKSEFNAIKGTVYDCAFYYI